MNKITVITTLALLAIISLIFLSGFGIAAPQYSVIDPPNDVQKLEKLLNEKARDGWKLHTYDASGPLVIFVKD